MNTEEISPLKGRIVVGSGKIRKGYKELQLSKILEDSSVFQRLEAENFDSLDSKCKLLSTYLYAWEHVYGVSFQAPTDATLTKNQRYSIHHVFAANYSGNSEKQ